jgi:tyrosinase
MSCTQRQRFLEAVAALKTLPDDNDLGIPNYDDFAQVHFQNNHFAHGFDAFLPWHRWFIYRFERALHAVTNDCSLFIPYWDWEVDGDPLNAKVLEADSFGSQEGTENQCVTEGLADFRGIWSTTVRGGCVTR